MPLRRCGGDGRSPRRPARAAAAPGASTEMRDLGGRRPRRDRGRPADPDRRRRPRRRRRRAAGRPLRRGPGRRGRALRARGQRPGHAARGPGDHGDARRRGRSSPTLEGEAPGRGAGGDPARRRRACSSGAGCRRCAAGAAATSTSSSNSWCPTDLERGAARGRASDSAEALGHDGSSSRGAATMIRLAVRCAPEHAEHGAGRAARARARRASRRSAAPAGSSSRSTGRRASCPSSASSRRPRAAAWSRSPPPRSPTTGPTAGRTSTSRSRSAAGSGCGPPGGSRRTALIDVVVDPGQAFGTGGHPTTRLCLELLLELEAGRRGRRARSPTGAPARACWRSPRRSSAGRRSPAATTSAALEAAAANAEANGVELALERVDVRESPPPVAPTVVANLTGNLLERLRAAISAHAGDAPARR